MQKVRVKLGFSRPVDSNQSQEIFRKTTNMGEETLTLKVFVSIAHPHTNKNANDKNCSQRLCDGRLSIAEFRLAK